MYSQVSETSKDQKTRRKSKVGGKVHLSSYLSIEVMLLRNSCRRDSTEGPQAGDFHSINAMVLKVSRKKKKAIILLVQSVDMKKLLGVQVRYS